MSNPHKYNTSEWMMHRLAEWIGENGGEDSTTLMVHEARETIKSLVAQQDADKARVYTYANQPTDNVIAWRLGEACGKAAKAPGGDYIDGGLSLLKELQAKGYGVVAIDAARAQQGGQS